MSLLNGIDWIFGLGLGIQRTIFSPSVKNSLTYIFEAPGTHNDYLAILTDMGLIGLFFFVYLFIKSLSTLRRLSKYSIGLRYMMYFYFTMVFVMFFDNYLDSLIMFLALSITATFIREAIINMRNDYNEAALY